VIQPPKKGGKGQGSGGGSVGKGGQGNGLGKGRGGGAGVGGGASGGSSFESPTSLIGASDFGGWWDFTDGANLEGDAGKNPLDTDLDEVRIAYDMSGNGRNLSASSGVGPDYYTAGYVESIYRTNNTAEEVLNIATGTLDTTQGWTMMIAGQRRSTTSYNVYAGVINYTNSTHAFVAGTVSTTGDYIIGETSIGTNSISGTATDGDKIILATFGGGTTHTVYDQNFNTATISGTLPTDFNKFCVFGYDRASAADITYDGKHYVAFFINRILTEDEITSLINWTKTTYGIS
jgi:hypothetical protein